MSDFVYIEKKEMIKILDDIYRITDLEIEFEYLQNDSKHAILRRFNGELGEIGFAKRFNVRFIRESHARAKQLAIPDCFNCVYPLPLEIKTFRQHDKITQPLIKNYKLFYPHLFCGITFENFEIDTKQIDSIVFKKLCKNRRCREAKTQKNWHFYNKAKIYYEYLALKDIFEKAENPRVVVEFIGMATQKMLTDYSTSTGIKLLDKKGKKAFSIDKCSCYLKKLPNTIKELESILLTSKKTNWQLVVKELSNYQLEVRDNSDLENLRMKMLRLINKKGELI
jgi:hypothetical protein